MGRFIYPSGVKVEFSDRALHHLEQVITTKLRRGEKFIFSWQEDASVGYGRTAVWLSAGVPLSFRYRDSRRAPFNKAWLEQLMLAADSPSGLFPLPEPVDEREQVAASMDDGERLSSSQRTAH